MAKTINIDPVTRIEGHARILLECDDSGTVAKGYFPVPALKYIDGPVLEMTRDALTSQAARDRGLFRETYLDALFSDPTTHITPLRGSELWQCALLELWLQAHQL